MCGRPVQSNPALHVMLVLHRMGTAAPGRKDWVHWDMLHCVETFSVPISLIRRQSRLNPPLQQFKEYCFPREGHFPLCTPTPWRRLATMGSPQIPTQHRCRAQAAVARTSPCPVQAEGSLPGRLCHPSHTALERAREHSMARTPAHTKLLCLPAI